MIFKKKASKYKFYEFIYMWLNFFLDIQYVVCECFQSNSIYAGMLLCAELKSDRIIIPKNRYSELRSPGIDLRTTGQIPQLQHVVI